MIRGEGEKWVKITISVRYSTKARLLRAKGDSTYDHYLNLLLREAAAELYRQRQEGIKMRNWE